jgi:uncharacterized LabA/DUF88 family protein
MTEENEEQRGEAPRRRRGSRGGRGRGAGAAVAAAEREPVRPVGGDEPRIVGRRPGRPAAGATDAAAPPVPAPQDTTITITPPEPAAAPRTRKRRAPAAVPAVEGGVDGLLGLVAEQTRALEALRAEVQHLAERVEQTARRSRLGVFVDVPNLLYGAERGERIDMGKLLAYLSRDRELVRATAYAPVSDNPSEPIQQQRFVAPFVPYEYRIVTKSLKRFADGSIKGNFDVEMAVDMISMADRLDVMAIVSGDADFSKVVEEAQSRGVRVEVVAFAGSTSAEMRALADHYIEVGSIAHLLR